MAKLKVCVIGAGTMGKKHINVFATTDDVVLAGICDLNLDVAKTVAAEYGTDISCYGSYQEMIETHKPDAVAIAVPDSEHKEPVMEALRSGAHVLVEKPLATTLADSDEMIAFAKKCGKILMVNYSHRWIPVYYTAHERLSCGDMGPVAMVYARKNDSIAIMTEWPWLQDSSPAAFLSSHDIDLVRWFIGCEAKSVYAVGYKGVLKRKLNMDTYDCIQATVKFENGAVAVFESSFIYPKAYPTLTNSYIHICCEDGLIELPRQIDSIATTTDTVHNYPQTSIAPMINGKVLGAFRWANEHFIECVKKGLEPLTSGYNARQISEIVEAIHLSLENGKVMELPLSI